MYKKIATTLMLTTTLMGIGLSTITVNPVESGELFFVCDLGYDKITDKKLPTTYSWYEGTKRSLIRWTKNLGNYTPRERCDLISPRFQKAYDRDGMNIIITNGYINEQPVICTANEYGGDCVTLLMTLRHNDNSFVVLNELKDALLGRRVGPPMRESGSNSNEPPQVYYQIDLEEALKNAPIEKE